MKKVESGHFLWVIAAAIVGGVFLGIAFGYGMGWDRALSTPVQSGSTNGKITNFEECAAAGNAVMESYPRQCRANGKTYVEQVAVPPTPPTSGGSCVVGGCSSQLCDDANNAANMVTDCMLRPEYSCYRSAKCERQATGKCGWTQTAVLKACLENPPAIQ